MVCYSEQHHTFNAPLHFIALAHNIRFPSPYSTHVISSDVIARSFHGSILRTTRLVLKRGKMPAWAPRVVAQIGTSWVLEETEVDLERATGKELRTRSRNLDHKTVLEVFEWQTFRPVEGDPISTEATTLSRVTSDFGFWPLRSRIEKFGLSRIPKASEKSRAGIELVASLLLDPATCSKLLAAGPLKPYTFDPVPSSLAQAVRAKFDEARAAVLRREEEETRIRDEQEPGKVWRERWRAAARRGVTTFKARVCAATGLLCEPKAT